MPQEGEKRADEAKKSENQGNGKKSATKKIILSILIPLFLSAMGLIITIGINEYNEMRVNDKNAEEQLKGVENLLKTGVRAEAIDEIESIASDLGKLKFSRETKGKINYWVGRVHLDSATYSNNSIKQQEPYLAKAMIALEEAEELLIHDNFEMAASAKAYRGEVLWKLGRIRDAHDNFNKSEEIYRQLIGQYQNQREKQYDNEIAKTHIRLALVLIDHGENRNTQQYIQMAQNELMLAQEYYSKAKDDHAKEMRTKIQWYMGKTYLVLGRFSYGREIEYCEKAINEYFGIIKEHITPGNRYQYSAFSYDIGNALMLLAMAERENLSISEDAWNKHIINAINNFRIASKCFDANQTIIDGLEIECLNTIARYYQQLFHEKKRPGNAFLCKLNSINRLRGIKDRPIHYAEIQYYIGQVYFFNGRYCKDTQEKIETYTQAGECFRNALSIHTRTRNPNYYAGLNIFLGLTDKLLTSLGEDRRDEAIDCFEKAYTCQDCGNNLRRSRFLGSQLYNLYNDKAESTLIESERNNYHRTGVLYLVYDFQGIKKVTGNGTYNAFHRQVNTLTDNTI
ncbi:MAG: tetratricopeptide repeat protein [Candidatus Alcyoniella australis]|nr:tetratricopeptide repeat protein [Candidatus Alcyoniella australis]